MEGETVALMADGVWLVRLKLTWLKYRFPGNWRSFLGVFFENLSGDQGDEEGGDDCEAGQLKVHDCDHGKGV
jgi:hypothetical protein